ncbi:glycine--tRNA ligase subunit beta [Nitrospira sp. NS4]|uniref:glycine--tRNA ligase subunit beta n=1 Tax=Nitrospira sp. NS4 TaxID=3414498 RepID=UPI003C2DE5DE
MPKTKKTSRASVAPRKTAGRAAPSTAELLVEIGVEELPYQFISPALAGLKESAERLLNEQRLTFKEIRTLGTPRRLTLVVEGLAIRQASVMKEAMGPSKAVAFDQAGQPTRAAMGFAAGQGVAVQELQVRQTPKGEYLFAVKREEGRPAKIVLTELVPQLVAKLSFPKAMKWNEAGVRFARPVRWLVALYGGAVLPVEAAGIKAGNRTRGHRVLGAKQGVVVRDCATYVKALEKQGVIPDPERRRTMIQEQVATLCKKTGVVLNHDESLLDQAVYTTEWPNAIIGSFKDMYLDVPEEILITSMKEHQGFFSLRDKNSGKLVAHFIAVTNNRVKDMGLIREGNERVLAARLADAKFFYDDDRTSPLQERVGKLAGVTFHQKIGTMGQKQERVAAIAATLARSAGLKDSVVQVCERAGVLCKADLLTGIVGEFPELQGIMGGYYARHDGEDPAVCQAILQHYRPHSMEGPIPESVEAQVLSLADRLDSLASFFHVGMVPTGSEDPFALRRHATAIVRILLEGLVRLDLGRAIGEARAIVQAAGVKSGAAQGDGQQRLVEFVFERVRHYARTVHGLRDDVVNAVVSAADRQSFDLRDLVAKMQALHSVASRTEFDPLIVGFKRAHRLVEKEQWERRPVEPSVFQDPAESALHKAVSDERDQMAASMQASDYGKALESLVRLKPAIDAFFAAVMVNADDQAVRRNRLSLLKDVDDFFMTFADFSQIVVQGG